MTPEQITQTILSLPTGFTDRTEESALAKIEETAAVLAPILAARGLQISKGGTSPSSKKSYARIYLETVGNTSHDIRHANCGVIKTWEWQTRSKYGFSPISAKAIKSFCDQILRTVQAVEVA